MNPREGETHKGRRVIAALKSLEVSNFYGRMEGSHIKFLDKDVCSTMSVFANSCVKNLFHKLGVTHFTASGPELSVLGRQSSQ